MFALARLALPGLPDAQREMEFVDTEVWKETENAKINRDSQNETKTGYFCVCVFF